MNDDLKNRLNMILDRITSPEFLSNSGLGNEIGFYIFDYPPEAELEVRQHVEFVMDKASKLKPELRIAHVNLFQLLVSYLKERGLLDKALAMQKDKGDEALFKALKGVLHEEKVAKELAKVAQPENHDFVFVTGVGTAYPLIRSHTLLNNLIWLSVVNQKIVPLSTQLKRLCVTNISSAYAGAELVLRRLITLIYAGCLPQDLSSSRSCLCLQAGIR